jgi:hypothetical protein
VTDPSKTACLRDIQLPEMTYVEFLHTYQPRVPVAAMNIMPLPEAARQQNEQVEAS